MSGYGMFCGVDGKAFIQEMHISDAGPTSLAESLPSNDWRPFKCDVGLSSPLHCCPIAGVTVVIGGSMKISVRGGEIPSVTLKKGDFILLFDVVGEGHATDIIGEEALEAISLSFPIEKWELMKPCFSPWPDVVFPELLK